MICIVRKGAYLETRTKKQLKNRVKKSFSKKRKTPDVLFSNLRLPYPGVLEVELEGGNMQTGILVSVTQP